jgi:hypothetical protein
MITGINSEDRLVQQTFARHLEQALGWDSIYAHNAETFGPAGTLGRASDRDAVLVRDHGCPVIATANHCNELIRQEIRPNSHRNDMFFARVISDKNVLPGGCAKMADAAWPHSLR